MDAVALNGVTYKPHSQTQFDTLDYHKILLVSCHFPPGGGIQVQRALGLARYLPALGFKVHVLTARNPRVPAYDAALLQSIPNEVDVHRTVTLEPSFRLRKRLWGGASGSDSRNKHNTSRGKALAKRAALQIAQRILSPDPQVLWLPTAMVEAERLVRRERIGIVIITAPPFSSFLIGHRLKSVFPDIRLISDFRDEWLRYFVNNFAFRRCEYVEKRAAEIERATVVVSDRIVAAAPAARDAIRCRYPDEPEEKFRTVSNGFDEDQFQSFRPRPRGAERIIVAYVGTMHDAVSPAPYLDALDRLPAEVSARFETRFVGRIAEEFDRQILENRKGKVVITPFVPHQEAIRQMEEADVLLSPCHDPLTIPGKVYEYLGTGRPILAFGNAGGDVDQMIRRTRVGWCADPKDHIGIDSILTRLATDPMARLTNPAAEEVAKFTRRHLTSVYASIVSSAVQSPL